MIRVAAALIAGLAATPAAAACHTLAEATPAIEKLVGAGVVVRPLPSWIATPVLEWIRDHGTPDAGADGFVAAVFLRGIVLFPVRGGRLCDGRAFHVTVEDTPAFLEHVRGWMDRRGLSKERAA